MPSPGERQRWPRAATVCGALLLVAGTLAAALSRPGSNDYQDDSFDLLRASAAETLTGDQGFVSRKFVFSAGDRARIVDARLAVFNTANSRNPNPSEATSCETGPLPVNPYPLRLTGGSAGGVAGGLFRGLVPQSSPWRATYCNSAAILFESMIGGRVDGVRIAGAWDAVRAGRGSDDLEIANSWISDVRDDAVENDYLGSLTLRDSLVDGAFQIVSIKPAKGNDVPDASKRMVTLSGVVLRIRGYPYGDAERFGALAKSEARSPGLQIINSIVAVDGASGRTFPGYWATGWAKLAGSSNNLLLWLGDDPPPSELGLPARGFIVLQGAEARSAWARARQNWIDCHPRLARLPEDPRSNPERCVPGTWGGYTS